jgi:putative photosynthetic complex assembly protein 2
MGLLTGPRRHACPAQCSGPRHFLHGVQACLYHELTIIVCAVLVVWATWGAPNQVGTWTFLSLWGMRQSAKLNVFLGVRNLGESFLPKHIAYLTSFMRRRAINPLFPVSIAVGSYVVFLLCRRAASPGITPFQAAAYSVVITMLALGVIEHWLLILPLPFDRLWVWWLRHTRPGQVAKPVPVALCDEQQAGAFPTAAAA